MVEWSFDIYTIQRHRKVSAQVSLRPVQVYMGQHFSEMHEAPYFTEHDSNDEMFIHNSNAQKHTCKLHILA